ncbi:MAG: O-antigen ligase family protein [Prevotellaceae bacterium]|nr:O-antigen ligase family protein [Prevotellaceae bacterium]
MIKELRDIAIGFFILAVAYSASLYGIILSYLNFNTGSIILRCYYLAMAAGVLLYFFTVADKISLKPFVNTFLIGVVVAILYYFARFHYMSIPIHSYLESNTNVQATNTAYYRNFFWILVHFIPSITMGALMLKDNAVLQKMEKALLPFMLLYTIALAKVIFSARISYSIGATFHDLSTMNYQMLSYYSMFAFGMTLYLICNRSYPKLFLVVMTALAALQLVMALTAGGRGAFVLGIVFCLYFGLTRLSVRRLILYLLLIGIVALVIQRLVISNDVFNLGYERIMNFFSNTENYRTDNRWLRWTLSYESFATSPIIGHGLGSVFYEVGYYSHNIFLDILCEGGLVLLSIFAFVMYRLGYLLRKSIKYDRRNELLLVLFLCSFINLCFSNYYLGESAIWLAVSYVLNRGQSFKNSTERDTLPQRAYY